MGLRTIKTYQLGEYEIYHCYGDGQRTSTKIGDKSYGSMTNQLFHLILVKNGVTEFNYQQLNIKDVLILNENLLVCVINDKNLAYFNAKSGMIKTINISYPIGLTTPSSLGYDVTEGAFVLTVRARLKMSLVTDTRDLSKMLHEYFYACISKWKLAGVLTKQDALSQFPEDTKIINYLFKRENNINNRLNASYTISRPHKEWYDFDMLFLYDEEEVVLEETQNFYVFENTRIGQII